MLFKPTSRFLFSTSQFDYSPLEEPSLKLAENKIIADNTLFEIVHKANTMKDLITFYTSSSDTMSLLHHSIFLNKCASVQKKLEEAPDADEIEQTEKIMRMSA